MSESSLRWRVLIGGIICMICAGIFYSWSLYVLPLIREFYSGIELTDEVIKKARSTLSWTFSIAAFLIPVTMIFAAKVLAKKGPTITLLIGAVSLTLGLVISGFAATIPMLYIGYGVLGGIGVGFIYGVPISTCAKWFPDKKGLITGLAIAGFGLGSIIFAPILTVFIQNYGPYNTFFFQAVVTLVGVAIGAPLMKMAPDGFTPAGWTPPMATGARATTSRDYTSGEMLRTSQYWFLLIMYLFANIAGLFTISNASPIAQEIASLTAIQAGTIVSLLAIFNTVGRFLSGWACDKIGARRVVTIIYSLNLILFLAFRFMDSYILIAIVIAGIAVCFGAIMGAYPSLVMDNFGIKNNASNYAFVFLAYGVGGLAGTGINTISTTYFSGYTTTFIIIAAFCAVGVVMSLLAKKPQ